MDKQTQQKIWKAIDNDPDFKLKTYRNHYQLIKTLNLGHRPTKEETSECMFYSVAKVAGKGDAMLGIKKIVESIGLVVKDVDINVLLNELESAWQPLTTKHKRQASDIIHDLACEIKKLPVLDEDDQ
jgi:hypothetical protein